MNGDEIKSNQRAEIKKKNSVVAKGIVISPDVYPLIADMVDYFEKYGTKFDTAQTLESIYKYITYPPAKLCSDLEEGPDISVEDREIKVRLLESAMTLTYYCMDSFNNSIGIIPQNILSTYAPTIAEHKRGSILLNKYLCFIVLTQKLAGYNIETLSEEFLTHNVHKKIELNKIVCLCEEVVRINNNDIPEMTDQDEKELTDCFPILPSYMQRMLYPVARILYPAAHELYYATMDHLISIDEKIKNDQKLISEKAADALWENEETDTSAPKKDKKVKKGKSKKAHPPKPPKPPETKTIAKSSAKSSAVAMLPVAPDDTTGFKTVVNEDTIRSRYFLSNVDYYTIETNALRIVEPLRHFLGPPELGITAALRYRRSGYYFNITRGGGLSVAHISFFHYGADMYHFKIDANEVFHIQPTDTTFTIPFNLHLVEGHGITNSVQSIINPSVDIKRNSDITVVVKDMLNLIVQLLNATKVGGRPRKTRKRRFRQRKTIKKKPTFKV